MLYSLGISTIFVKCAGKVLRAMLSIENPIAPVGKKTTKTAKLRTKKKNLKKVQRPHSLVSDVPFVAPLPALLQKMHSEISGMFQHWEFVY